MNKLFPLLLLCLLSSTVFSQDNEQLTVGFDQEIEALLATYNAVGLSIAIVKDNQVVYSKGFGYRDLEKQLPVTENTVFHIASMSKAFTGALLGILEEEDQLSLKDRPALYVPNFQFYNEKMNNLITIGDLLSHRSGIGNQGSSIVMFPDEDKLKTVQRLQYLKPEGEVKNSWIYSNIGYTLAGVVAEQVTGRSWDKNMQERIFNPLSMNSSYTTVEEMMASDNFSLGYARYQGETVKTAFENYYSWTPAGAIKSTVNDLSNWMLAWLNQGSYNNQQVIPENYVRAATSLQNTKDEVYEKDVYLGGEGFGWRLRSWYGHYHVRHGGNTNGFSTVMDLYPFDNLGIVVLCNQKSSLLPYAISDYVTRKLLELPSFDVPVIVHDIYKPELEDISLNEEKKPTHPLVAYTGKYVAKGFGEIEVVLEDNKLFTLLPTYKFQLVHRHYNNFYLKGMEDFAGDFDPDFTIEFFADRSGDIDLLKLYTQKEPVVFYKE